jgi:hypothetical protein
MVMGMQAPDWLPVHVLRAQSNKMASMKGNDGRAARRHLLRRLGLVLGTFGVCLSILVLLGVGGGRFRQRKRRFALFDMGFRSQSEKKQQHAFKLDTTPLIANEQQVEQMILEASLHLVDLEVDYEELAYSPSDAYAGIYGRFCPLNFAAHKKNPTAGTTTQVCYGNQARARRMPKIKRSIICSSNSSSHLPVCVASLSSFLITFSTHVSRFGRCVS